MKKIILLSICLLIGAWTLRAQQTIYIIDNETVENFDGSQLKDRTIRDYKITTKGSGRNAITVHTITTTSSPFSVSQTEESSLSPSLPKKVVYVIDGRVSQNENDIKSLSPEDIERISVYKSPEANKDGEHVTVIRIQTKRKAYLLESLKGLPGVKVEADGSISVNGLPVKKITINGRDYSVDTE